jgi:hypothetical protein
MNPLLSQRDREFLAECRRLRDAAAARRENPTNSQIVGQAILARPSCYHVSYDYALSAIYRHRAGQRQPRGTRRLMWDELQAKVAAKTNSRRNIGQALADVLASSRPSRFFISQPYALRLYERLRSRRPRRPINPATSTSTSTTPRQ